MKKIRFIISTIISILLLFSVLACNNLISSDITNKEENSFGKTDGFGQISASIFIPDYKKMADASRLVAPQTTKVRLSYRKQNIWINSGILDIDMSSLEKINNAPEEFPGGLWKGTFNDIPSGTYGSGSLKIELLNEDEKILTSGTNSEEIIISVGGTSNATLYTTPFDVNADEGTLESGKMLFWMFSVDKETEYNIEITAEGTYPDIVLFNANGTFNKYYSVNNAEDATIPIDEVEEITSYYVGIYADEGDVASYSIKIVANTEKKVSFDLSGALALATFEDDGSRSSRAIVDEDDVGVLGKVLADGSIKSVIKNDIGVELPQIKYIMQSPSSTNNQLYVVFPHDVYLPGYTEYLYYDKDDNLIGKNKDGVWIEGAYKSISKYKQERVFGSLICVYEDGSYVDVLASDDETSRQLEEYWNGSEYTYMIEFDDLGYMYYIARECVDGKETRIIYRYNPVTKESEQLTVGMEGYYYSKIQVSKDGQWMFVRGRSDAAYAEFIKAIPVEIPDNAENLLYSSSGWLNIGDWLYDDKTDAVYVASDVTGKQGLVKFIKNSSGNFVGDSYEIFTNRNNSSSGNPYEGKYLCNNMKSYSYPWADDYLNDDGSVNATRVIQNIVDTLNRELPRSGYVYYDIYNYNEIYNEETEEWEYNNELIKEKAKFNNYYYWADYTDIDGNQYDSNYSFSVYYWNSDYTECSKDYSNEFCYEMCYELNTGYKAITVDDVDIRFDNPVLAKLTYNSMDYKQFAEDMAGLKNEEAINAINDTHREILYYARWDSRYASNSTGSAYYRKNLFLADILYLKDTDTLLCKDTEASHFPMLSTNIKYFADSWVCNDVVGDMINSRNVPRWNDEYYGDNEKLDYSKILDYLFSFSTVGEGEYEFRLDVFKDDDDMDDFYSEKTDEEALEFMCSDDALLSRFGNIFRYDYYDESEGWKPTILKFVAKTCFVKGTDNSIIPNLSSSSSSGDNSVCYPDWWNEVRSLAVFDGEIWGVYNYWNGSSWDDYKIVRFLDKDGKYVGEHPSALKDLHLRNISVCENGYFFKNIFVDAAGAETGKQDIRMYNVLEGKLINLFDSLANKDSLTVETMRFAGTKLYVCVTIGLDVSNYCIDIETLNSEKLGVSRKFKDIINFRM